MTTSEPGGLHVVMFCTETGEKKNPRAESSQGGGGLVSNGIPKSSPTVIHGDFQNANTKSLRLRYARYTRFPVAMATRPAAKPSRSFLDMGN
jgi:hypothetical protein